MKQTIPERPGACLMPERRKEKETKYSSDFKITDIPMKMNVKNWLIYQLFLLPKKNILQLF